MVWLIPLARFVSSKEDNLRHVSSLSIAASIERRHSFYFLTVNCAKYLTTLLNSYDPYACF